MHLSASTVTLLTFLTSTSAFIPINVDRSEPLRSTHFAIVTVPEPSSTSSNILPTQTISTVPSEDGYEAEELKRRQVTGQGAAVALPTAVAADQVSPVTTYDILQWKPGAPAPVQIEVIFTQLFASPLDPWPSATAGAIGLGTIQGEIGVVRTKVRRDVETSPLQTFAPRAIPKSGGESEEPHPDDPESEGEPGKAEDSNGAGKMSDVASWKVIGSFLSALVAIGGLGMF